MNKEIIYNSPEQLDLVHRQSMSLINHLNEDAINELFSGEIKDIDTIMQIVEEETNRVMFGDGSHTFNEQVSLEQVSWNFEHHLRCSNFNYFMAACLPDMELSWHHLEWGSMVQIYRLLGILAARGHSKSITFSKAYPLWRLYRYDASSTDISRATFSKGLIVSNEQSLGATFLEEIKKEIESNPSFAHLVPKDKTDAGGKWQAHEISCGNGANIVVKSYGGRIRGRHPHWIVVDDFLDDSAIYSSTQRAKFKNIFHSVIMNALEPGGQCIAVGTPFSDADLYAELKKLLEWRVFEYPAIFPDGKLLCSSRFGIDQLLNKRISQGNTIFSREVLVKPISSESTIFPYEIVSKSFTDTFTLIYNKHSLPKGVKFKAIALGCDFALSANTSADCSVFITLGLDEFNNHWLLNVWWERGKTFHEQTAIVRKLHSDFSYDNIVMESNQMQKIFVQEAEKDGLPVHGHNTTAKSKYNLEEGLPSLSIILEQGRFKFPTGDKRSKDLTERAAIELASIAYTDKGKLEGVGEHDDFPMALLMAVKAIRMGSGFVGTFI